MHKFRIVARMHLMEHAILDPYHCACTFGWSRAVMSNLHEVDFLAYGVGPLRNPTFCDFHRPRLGSVLSQTSFVFCHSLEKVPVVAKLKRGLG